MGLAQQGFTVTVLEKTAPPAFDPASAPDVRISAISAASVGLLKSLGVWDAVRAMRVHAYRRLETREWESAHVAFDAAELKLPELGYMVENKVLQWGLWQALTAHEGVTLRVGGELEAMQRGEAETALRLRDGETIHARLVIGADGASSQVREMAGIGVHARQYQQSCMLISVQCADDPGDSTGSSLPPADRALSCRCSITGPRWCGMTPRRGSVSCRVCPCPSSSRRSPAISRRVSGG